MKIQTLQNSEIGLLKGLQPDGWQDIIPIFDFYTQTDFCFPVKVTINNKIVGIGAGIVHNNIAWLGHIIVHSDNRNKGIGKLITQSLIELMKTKHCEPIYLIATDLGASLYERIGFETETEYMFFKDINKKPNWLVSKNIKPITKDFHEQIYFIDKINSGEDRIFHIQKYFSRGFVYLHEKVVEGYYLPTFGEGLIIANRPTAGLELMKMRLLTKDNAAFPIDNLNAIEFMHQHNYQEFKRAKRMRFGSKQNWFPENIYNRIAGNLG
ncbi:MAG: GNAT family N-acetyltransferase [Bacteroidetes bacterium]|nr:GNAT family N-acetyltransferase [Bacteroidota bacterium]HET6244598.1 GNAT family N-acetyltransferase [Bacteroidia bacterium]